MRSLAGGGAVGKRVQVSSALFRAPRAMLGQQSLSLCSQRRLHGFRAQCKVELQTVSKANPTVVLRAARPQSAQHSFPHNSYRPKPTAVMASKKGDTTSKSEPEFEGGMLMLIGLPGSGKSTFAQALLRRAPDVWVLVSQDTIDDGSPGTKKQCLAVTKEALSEGWSVIIDRCNVDFSQRRAFQELALDIECPLYAVVFKMPLQECINRVTSRVDHPSGVEGPEAAGLVRSFHQALEAGGLPTPDEGYDKITICWDNTDVKEARDEWTQISDKLQEEQED